VVLGVYAHRYPYFAVDVAITRQVQSFTAAWFGDVLYPLNALGFPPLVAIVYGLIVLALFAARARVEAVCAGVAALGGSALNHLTKALVDRPRPGAELVRVAHHLAGSGYPAGHVLNFTAFAGFLCYVACVRMARGWARTAVVVAIVSLIALMGVARIDAGEHWPSDVLGGYLIGFVWMAISIELYRRATVRHGARPARAAADAPA
jgi:undecaprenyl-diphosphatase